MLREFTVLSYPFGLSHTKQKRLAFGLTIIPSSPTAILPFPTHKRISLINELYILTWERILYSEFETAEFTIVDKLPEKVKAESKPRLVSTGKLLIRY